MNTEMKKKTSHPVDAVITWVDGNDAEWIKERNIYSPRPSESRYFRDWGTIKYVLRGIDTFMPWIDKVHFVTWGHVPSWLNMECGKLHVVRHSDFFARPSDLPVFNSNAIEANLHLIPNLSEEFIYFNDDMLVLRQAPKERFFQENLPMDFMVQGIPRKGFLYRKFRSNEIYVDIVLNELNLLNSKFSKRELLRDASRLFYSKNYSKRDVWTNALCNVLWKEYAWLKLYHHPQPYLKSALLLAHELYSDVLSKTSANKFRGREDVCQYIYRDVQLASGKFVPYTPKDAFCLNINSYDCLRRNRANIERARFFCANDSVRLKGEEFELTRDLLIDILESILPKKSVFEN